MLTPLRVYRAKSVPLAFSNTSMRRKEGRKEGQDVSSADKLAEYHSESDDPIGRPMPSAAENGDVAVASPDLWLEGSGTPLVLLVVAAISFAASEINIVLSAAASSPEKSRVWPEMINPVFHPDHLHNAARFPGMLFPPSAHRRPDPGSRPLFSARVVSSR